VNRKRVARNPLPGRPDRGTRRHDAAARRIRPPTNAGTGACRTAFLWRTETAKARQRPLRSAGGTGALPREGRSLSAGVARGSWLRRAHSA
jgi:hypothetical protein